MPELIANQSLQAYNTFGFDVTAKWFCIIESVEDLTELLKKEVYKNNQVLFIGGGSNILLKSDFAGLVVINRIKGIEIIKPSNEDYVYLKAGGGESWHELVMRSIQEGLGGLENLSLIPGTVGAAPMQNIGAYGVEIKDVFSSLQAFNLNTGVIEEFDKEQCKFGYRDSIFKQDLKGKFIIVSVTFKLYKAHNYQVAISYGAIQEVLKVKNIFEPTIQDVSAAVIEIRQSKLPNPKEIGNSGSFFKNPIVDREKYAYLKENYPEMPAYEISAEEVKLAAGWLIEKAGWKGYQENGVGVHHNQALVLVNHGDGSGLAIAQLANKIQDSIQSTFGIELSPEVNFI